MDNWNGITPASGMLVVDKHGNWQVTFGLRGALYMGASPMPIDATDCTCLAPAPTPGGLWAALRPLAFDCHCGAVFIGHEPSNHDIYSRIYVHKPLIADLIIIRSEWTAYSLPLLDTARQHHGTLLAYCAQPGWEATR